jgi:hypothetical protein
MIKKLVVSLIVLPLLIVPLFCCCIKQASAATVGEDHCQNSQDEHGATSGHADHNSSHSCDCHSFSTAAENPQTVSIAFLSVQKLFPSVDFTEFRQTIFTKGSMRLAYLGPPIGVLSEVPLYTLYHSLRI